eukprot:593875-Rhodomonas_salina.1
MSPAAHRRIHTRGAKASRRGLTNVKQVNTRAPPVTLYGASKFQSKSTVWKENYYQLADVGMLEPNPANRKQAMKNERLRLCWIDSEGKELRGLWKRGCLKRWKRGDLKQDDRVFCSRFHYNIKRDGKTGQITNCKVRLVVMGHKMKEGEDFEDSFAPVPHATAGCIIISMAAGMDLELHSCDLTQAFIQADKLDEGINGRIFISPTQGADEDALWDPVERARAPSHALEMVQGTGLCDGRI